MRYKILIFLVIPFLIVSLSVDCFALSNWHVIPSLSISETYDNNIYSSEEGVEDYITRLGGSLSTVYDGSEVSFRGTYSTGINTYARHPEHNNIAHDGNLKLDLTRSFQRLVRNGKLTIKDDLTYTSDLRDFYIDEANEEIGSLSSYGIRTRQSDTFRNAVIVKIERPVSQRTNLTTAYTNRMTEYKDTELNDNMTHTVGFGVGYAYPRGSVYGNCSLSSIRVETDDSIGLSFDLGVKHKMSEWFFIDAEGGLVFVESEGDRSKSTLRGKINMTRRSNEHIYNAGYSRILNTVSGVTTDPTIADIFYISLTNIHTDVLNSSIGANYAINRSLTGKEVQTDSYNVTASLNYIIRKWLRSSFSISHFRQETEVESLSVPDMRREMVTLTFVGIWN